MYVCICNGLNERKVNEALTGGAVTVSRIYKHFGCAAKCGKCVPVMRDMLESFKGPGEAEPALA